MNLKSLLVSSCIILASFTPRVSAQDSIAPVSFTGIEDSIALVFLYRKESRKDTFAIDRSSSVGFLKEQLIKHYDLKFPPQLIERAASGGYNLNTLLLANQQPQYREGNSIQNAEVDPYALLDLDFMMTQNAIMACQPISMVIQVDGISPVKGVTPTLTIGGTHVSSEVTVAKDKYQFYFDAIGLCNYNSWIGKLELGDERYYLTNPVQADFKTKFDADDQLIFEVPEIKD
ncbi:hypothetical protein [Croceiramulus getboli]|nr:hypothetical protein P8624_00210 [Flavobacteriaceae bacterium YJPT1-3]